jgi:hypothetical protein
MNRQRVIGIILAGLLVCYPLSSGPVVRFYFSRHRFEDPLPKAIRDFYSPLAWLGQQCPPFGKALDWYGELWMRE